MASGKTKQKESLTLGLEGKAILIGNSLNRQSSPNYDSYSWDSLLNDVSREFTGNMVKNGDNRKPFSMFYDEIINYLYANNGLEESEVRVFIRERLKQLRVNPKYDFVSSMKYDSVLTTNYDYLLEQKLDARWSYRRSSTRERSYSIHRYQEASNLKIWHIHGEQNVRNSMLLGFRSYINYAAEIKKIANDYLKSKSKPDQADVTREPSWVEMFFTYDIDIVGLGMDFTEYTIWWLLAYRHFTRMKSKTSLSNTIRYFAADFDLEAKPFLKEMLSTYGVDVVETKARAGDYDDFFQKVSMSLVH